MARPGFSQHRKFKRLTKALGSAITARGALELIWDACYENGDDFLGSADDVELTAQWDGIPGALVLALSSAGGDGKAGFIELDPQQGGWRVHDLFENAPEYVQKRLIRELARKARGATISSLRSEAGKKGRAVQLAGANGGQTAANNGQVSDVCPEKQASVGQAATNGDTPAPAPAPVTTPLPPKGGRKKGKVSEAEPGLSAEDLAWFEKAREEYPKESPDGKPIHRGTRAEGLALWHHLLTTRAELTGRILRGCQVLMLQAQEECGQKWRYGWLTVYGPKKAPWQDFETEARRRVAATKAPLEPPTPTSETPQLPIGASA